MTTRNEMTAMINAANADFAATDTDFAAANGGEAVKFHGDYHDVFGISDAELDRILTRATTAEEFTLIWAHEAWWADKNNAA